jgi:hypothetical protein
MGPEAAKEFHKIFTDYLDEWAIKIQKRRRKCDTIKEIPKQVGLLQPDFIGRSREEITSALRSMLSPKYKHKKGPPD